MKVFISCSTLSFLLASATNLASSHAENLRVALTDQVIEKAFADFQQNFDKTYETEEVYQYRKAVFMHNLHKIHHHNQQQSSYRMGVNAFTDRTDDEMPLGYNKARQVSRQGLLQDEMVPLGNYELPLELPDVSLEDLPAEVDWRASGKVTTPIKNQGHCGSCWAFASTAVLESHIAIQTGKLFSLSMQELVSCVPNPNECGGDGGCTGATSELAFDFVAEHGMVEEYSFGYQSFHGEQVNCTILPSSSRNFFLKATDSAIQDSTLNDDDDMAKGAVAAILGYSKLPMNQYKALMVAVATLGPVSVSVAASSWSLYKSGVFDDDKSDNRVINHAVVLEGYGTDEETGQDYWLVRNSWGPLWGENGYIRLKRVNPATLDDPANDCKIDDHPADGVACTKDDSGKDIVPPNVSVCGTSGILFDSTVPIGGHLVA